MADSSAYFAPNTHAATNEHDTYKTKYTKINKQKLTERVWNGAAERRKIFFFKEEEEEEEETEAARPLVQHAR